MKMLALILGLLGGVCAVFGIVTALDVLAELGGLTWMFWFVLAGILLLGCIAARVNSGGEYE